MQRLFAFVLLLSLVGCGATAPHTAPPPTSRSERRPQSLDEALAAQGLTRLELSASRRESASLTGDGPVVEGGQVRVLESAGWSASPTVFARRSDGTVVIVVPRPNVIVDRHVDGGCLGFAGGRAWFEEATYALPDGAAFGGTVDVTWDEHTEAVDHSDTQADGSPCPPPAID